MKTQSAESTELEVRGPAQMINEAVQKGADLEKLKGLLDLQERWEANEARKAFNKAMSAFKANPPKIVKDKAVSFGQGKASYKHASLQNVCEEINKALSVHGLSASWRVHQNGQISVTCKIAHELGHSEETTLSAPADSSGSKNAIQAIGSTITYLERYTLLALTGLATEDQDDDAKNVGVEFISDEDLIHLEQYVKAVNADLTKFLKFMGVESLDKIKKSDYPKALAALKEKEKKK